MGYILAMIFSKLGVSTILPLAGIVNVIVVVPAMIISNKNLIKMLILSIIYTPFYLIISSSFAPAITDLARSVGTIDIPVGQTISYFGVEAPFFRWAISNGLAMKWYGIVGILVFAGLYFIFYKSMSKTNK